MQGVGDIVGIRGEVRRGLRLRGGEHLLLRRGEVRREVGGLELGDGGSTPGGGSGGGAVGEAMPVLERRRNNIH